MRRGFCLPPSRAYTRLMPRKPTKSTGAVREWRINLVRAKGQYLGRVEAPDAETAIKEAIRIYGVPEAQRSRLIAQPSSSGLTGIAHQRPPYREHAAIGTGKECGRMCTRPHGAKVTPQRSASGPRE
jgi:hypothetical protein